MGFTPETLLIIDDDLDGPLFKLHGLALLYPSFLAIFRDQGFHSFGKELRLINFIAAVYLNPTRQTLRAFMEYLQGFLLCVTAEQEHAREAGSFRHFLAQGLHDPVGVMPLLLVCVHEASQEIGFDAGLREDHLRRPVNFSWSGCR